MCNMISAMENIENNYMEVFPKYRFYLLLILPLAFLFFYIYQIFHSELVVIL